MFSLTLFPRKHRKHVDSCNAEFGYELITVIPFAYYLFLKNMLKSTTSAKGSASLYYFSPNHTETNVRSFLSYRKRVALSDIPNKQIHVPRLDTRQWQPPPYKQHYYNERLQFDVVILNKYTKEWKGPPVNFIDTASLERILWLLRHKSVLYIRMDSRARLDDDQPAQDLGEWDMLQSFGNVRTLQSVANDFNLSYNEAQLRCLAGCNQFISVQGGTSILASYFGGTNIVLVKRCISLRRGGYNYYWRLGDSSLKLCHAAEEVERAVAGLYV
jgi:hypothetical protein